MSGRLTQVDLRPGLTRDLGMVGIIMGEAFDPRFGESWTPAQCLGILSLPGVWLTMADLDHRPAGFALARIAADEAELLLLATRPESRGRGVGGALLRGVLADARMRGAARIHLEVRAGNDAVRLYQRSGFIKQGERRNYYRGRTGEQFDAHSYSLPLPRI